MRATPRERSRRHNACGQPLPVADRRPPPRSGGGRDHRSAQRCPDPLDTEALDARKHELRQRCPLRLLAACAPRWIHHPRPGRRHRDRSQPLPPTARCNASCTAASADQTPRKTGRAPTSARTEWHRRENGPRSARLRSTPIRWRRNESGAATPPDWTADTSRASAGHRIMRIALVRLCANPRRFAPAPRSSPAQVAPVAGRQLLQDSMMNAPSIGVPRTVARNFLNSCCPPASASRDCQPGNGRSAAVASH